MIIDLLFPFFSLDSDQKQIILDPETSFGSGFTTLLCIPITGWCNWQLFNVFEKLVWLIDCCVCSGVDDAGEHCETVSEPYRPGCEAKRRVGKMDLRRVSGKIYITLLIIWLKFILLLLVIIIYWNYYKPVWISTFFQDDCKSAAKAFIKLG